MKPKKVIILCAFATGYLLLAQDGLSQTFSPKDPYRIIANTTNVVGAGWVQFYGTVLEVQKGGIRMQAICRAEKRDTGFGPKGVDTYGTEFFVEGFPYEVAENDFLGADQCLCAIEKGVYTYTTTSGASRTIHKLIYGEVYTPPPPKPLTPEQIAAAKSAADQKKKAAAERALKANQEAAAKADSFGLLRMGERYRDGEGVEKDLDKARSYLQKAADTGSPTAAEELSKLNQTMPNK